MHTVSLQREEAGITAGAKGSRLSWIRHADTWVLLSAVPEN